MTTIEKINELKNVGINEMVDRTCKDKPYLIGRAVALTESSVDVPKGFAALVQVNPLQKLPYHLRMAVEAGNEELALLAEEIGSLPARMIDPRGQYYIGYYHQKGASHEE